MLGREPSELRKQFWDLPTEFTACLRFLSFALAAKPSVIRIIQALVFEVNTGPALHTLIFRRVYKAFFRQTKDLIHSQKYVKHCIR